MLKLGGAFLIVCLGSFGHRDEDGNDFIDFHQ